MRGSFTFLHQRVVTPAGTEARLGVLGVAADGSGMSAGPREVCLYYATQMSFDRVAHIAQRLTGERLASDEKIWNLVQARATEISASLRERVDGQTGQMPAIAEEADIYSNGASETMLLIDGILTTRQKSLRVRRKAGDGPSAANGACASPQAAKTRRSKATRSGRVSTDAAMVECRDGAYRYLTAGIDRDGNQTVSLDELVAALVRQEYGYNGSPLSRPPLNLVAVTDGAQNIRAQLGRISGHPITLILDWYHLAKRMYDKMSMVARNKDDKQEHVDNLMPLLWTGKVDDAIRYLNALPGCRNDKVRDEMTGYLDNHRREIIDYGRRKEAGKTIGSGRMEKGVGQVVANRQKRKGMTWTDKGSKSLAILQAANLDNQWTNPLGQLNAITG